MKLATLAAFLGSLLRLAGPARGSVGSPIRPSVALFQRGDVNRDGVVGVTDALAIAGTLFAGADPIRCADVADVNAACCALSMWRRAARTARTALNRTRSCRVYREALEA